jgi:hypothetical protein
MGIYDGARADVSDEVLERLKQISTATAWGFLVREGIRKPFMLGCFP